MNASTAIKKFGLEQAFNYLYKDPKENLVKLMDWADKFAGGEFETQRKLIREQHAVICKTAAIVGSELAELSVKRLRIDTYTH